MCTHDTSWAARVRQMLKGTHSSVAERSWPKANLNENMPIRTSLQNSILFQKRHIQTALCPSHSLTNHTPLAVTSTQHVSQRGACALSTRGLTSGQVIMSWRLRTYHEITRPSHRSLDYHPGKMPSGVYFARLRVLFQDLHCAHINKPAHYPAHKPQDDT